MREVRKKRRKRETFLSSLFILSILLLSSFSFFLSCQSKLRKQDLLNSTNFKTQKIGEDKLDSPLSFHERDSMEERQGEERDKFEFEGKRESLIRRGDLESLDRLKEKGQETSFTPPSFLVGEKSVFSLYWGLFKIGTVVLEVLPFYKSGNKNLDAILSEDLGLGKDLNRGLDENQFYHFSMTIRSSLWFFDFENKIDSYVHVKSFKPKFVEIYEREKRRLKEIKLSFYWRRKKVKYFEVKTFQNKKGVSQKEKLSRVLEMTGFGGGLWSFPQDIVTSLFYLRGFDLGSVRPISPFYVIEKSHTYRVIPSLLGKERIKTSLGVFHASLLKLNFEKGLKDSKKPNIKEVKLWIVERDKRYEVRNFTVKMEIKIKKIKLRGYLRKLKKGA